MRILFDENIPAELVDEFVGNQLTHLNDLGWKGKKNGALLQEASGQYDVLVTTDVNLYSQQEIETHDIAVLVLRAYQNKYEGLLPLVPDALRLLPQLQSGQLEFLYISPRLEAADRRRKRGPYASRRS